MADAGSLKVSRYKIAGPNPNSKLAQPLVKSIPLYLREEGGRVSVRRMARLVQAPQSEIADVCAQIGLKLVGSGKGRAALGDSIIQRKESLTLSENLEST